MCQSAPTHTLKHSDMGSVLHLSVAYLLLLLLLQLAA